MALNVELARQFSGLELFARGVVEGFLTGLHKSPYHGFSVEFSEHRQYNSGESTRNVDWKLFGKTERMYVKKYEEETNLRCQLVIDTSSSMFFPLDKNDRKPGSRNKIDFAIHAAAAFMYLLRKQRDAVGLSLFNEELDFHIPAKGSEKHQRLIIDRLNEMVENYSTNDLKKTFAVEALHELAEKLPKRSLVILFSDLFENSGKNMEELFLAFQHLRHNKHEIIVFNVVDNQLEYRLDFENRPHTFIDMETNERINLNPEQVKRDYQAAIKAFEHEIDLKCGNFQIDYNTIDIAEGFDQLFLSYLSKRSRMS